MNHFQTPLQLSWCHATHLDHELQAPVPPAVRWWKPRAKLTVTGWYGLEEFWGPQATEEDSPSTPNQVLHESEID